MASTIFCGRAFIGFTRLSSWKKPLAKCRTLAAKIESPKTIEPSSRIERNPSYEELEKELKKEGKAISSTPYVPEAPGLLMVISGPSGVGKDSVVSEVRKVYKEKEANREFAFIVTATTRLQRQGEVDGKDYYFVSKKEFEQWIENDELYEYSLVYGDYKGVPRKQIERELDLGHDCILRLDVKGVATMKSLHPDCISVFLAPHSQKVLVDRLTSRQTESMEQLMSRIRSSEEEQRCMENDEIFDYVLENAKDKQIETALKLYDILTVERMRRSRLFCKIKHNNS